MAEIITNKSNGKLPEKTELILENVYENKIYTYADINKFMRGLNFIQQNILFGEIRGFISELYKYSISINYENSNFNNETSTYVKTYYPEIYYILYENNIVVDSHNWDYTLMVIIIYLKKYLIKCFQLNKKEFIKIYWKIQSDWTIMNLPDILNY